jgi:predicted porin
MKKSLIALAALATVATAAQAQSSVTVYGIIDSGVLTTNAYTAGSQTSVHGGILATSRLGFKGTEDLGGGLKANFNLESGLNSDTGALQTVLFDRQSWVGLDQAGVGQIQVGRTTRLDFDAVVAGDTFGAANFGGNVGVVWGNINSTGSTVASSRSDNSIKVTSASFGGFTVAAQLGLGEQAGDANKEQFTALSADYTKGNARVTYAYSQTNDSVGGKKYETNLVTGSYNFGVAKVFGGYATRQQHTLSNDVKVQYLGATAPVTAKITLLAQATKVDNKAGVAADDAKTYAVGALYALSNRTTAYLLGGRATNDGAAAQGLYATTAGAGAAPTAGRDHSAYAVGIRHTF